MANKFLGFALLDYGKIVMPVMGRSFPTWGSASKRHSSAVESTLYTLAASGKNNCAAYYADSVDNQAVTTAIGFAHNFSVMKNGYGIGSGLWYIPHPYECSRIIQPNLSKLEYLTQIIFGASLNTVIWTSEDASTTTAYRYNGDMGTVAATDKSTSVDVGLILMCDMQMLRQAAS